MIKKSHLVSVTKFSIPKLGFADSKIKAMISLGLLFSSRAGGVLVALVFLPLYARLLDVQEFGLATLVLTGQSIVLTLDLGMAALMTRESAAAVDKKTMWIHLQRAEILLAIYYLGFSLIVIYVFVHFNLSVFMAVTCAAMYFVLTLQNIYHSIMLGSSRHLPVASVQIVGVLFRALICVATLYFIEASLLAFVLSQLAGAILHMLLTRLICKNGFKSFVSRPIIEFVQLYELARRGFPLLVVGLAGAVAMNFDKPIVAWFMTPEALAPYFLAGAFSLTPLGVLAAPVVQLYQPIVVRAYVNRDPATLFSATVKLNLLLLLVVVLPTVVLWVFREPIIALWLQHDVFASQVSTLSAWLLPAAAIGAFGNTPLALLIASSDFSFQAKLSVVLSALVLVSVAWSAWANSLLGVCISYLAYHILATLCLWWRYANRKDLSLVARRTAFHAVLAAVCLIAAIFIWVY